ncbi:MAG: competence protein TfoX, partial [Lachnospiraceae bacterium]|nr:competence protein TfoX [Lachnospiraceae bacterium]
AGFCTEQPDALPEITYRKMMGEYILYYRGKIMGGIYDDRLLVKNIPSAGGLIPDAPVEIPYEGAAGMLLVEEVEDRALLRALFEALHKDLPAPKKKKKL